MGPIKLLLIFSLSLFLSACAEDKQSVVSSNSATIQSQPQKTETTIVSCDQFSNFDPFSIPEIKSAIEPLLMHQIEKDFKASGGFITNPRRNLVPSLSLIFYNIKWKLVSCPVDKIPKNVNWRFFEKTELAAHTGKEILIFGPTFILMNSLDKAKAIVREAMFSFYLMKYFNLDQICDLKVDEYLGPNTSLVELCSNDFLDKNRDQIISEKYEKINSQDLENINKSAGWIISKLIAGNQQVDDVFYDTYINQLIKNNYDIRFEKVLSKDFRNYQVKLTTLPEFKNILEPILDKTGVLIFKWLKFNVFGDWYILDRDPYELGFHADYYDNVVVQTDYKSLSESDKAQVLLKQIIQVFYTSKYTKADAMCKMMRVGHTGSLRFCNDIDLLFSKKMEQAQLTGPLLAEEAKNIESVADWLWKNKDKIDQVQFEIMIRNMSFDTRFLSEGLIYEQTK